MYRLASKTPSFARGIAGLLGASTLASRSLPCCANHHTKLITSANLSTINGDHVVMFNQRNAPGEKPERERPEKEREKPEKEKERPERERERPEKERERQEFIPKDPADRDARDRFKKNKHYLKRPARHHRRPYPYEPIQKQTIHHCIAVNTAAKYLWDELGTYLRKTHGAISYVAEEVIHVSYKAGAGEMFYFSDGCVVFWNVSSEDRAAALEELKQFEAAPREHEEEEEMEYTFQEMPSALKDDTVVIDSRQMEKDKLLDMLAFSYGLLRSVKLAVIEKDVEDIMMPMKEKISKLKTSGRIEIDDEESFNKTMGQLISTGSDLNLFTDITDTPEIYWEDSRREDLWKKTSLYLDVYHRISQMNKKIQFAKDVIDIVKRDQNEKHSRAFEQSQKKLEWMIIVLIFIEVVFGTVDFLKDGSFKKLWSSSPTEQKQKE
jgi:uncharacterized Rmd1/YagE family protein